MKQPELKPADSLSDTEIAELLPHVGFVESWCKDIRTLALQRVEHGHNVPGYKLVAGRSVRKWKDGDAVTRTLLAHGLTPEQFETTKLIGITAAEKLLGGKKAAGEILAEITIKPNGKPTLAPESDKRPSIKTSAESDFS